MDPRQPRTFETLTLPNIAARCFVVRVADDQIRPDNIPAAGTAYNAAANTLPNRILQDIWGSYVYGWPIEAPTDYSAFAFVPALPTTPTIKPRIDNIWGNVIDHTYYCLRSATLPNVADTAVSVLGASYSTRHVIAVSEPREMSGEVIEVTVTTAAAATVTQTDKPIDPETNIATTRTRTWTVATASPEPSSIDSDGEYTKVEQISHRTFLSTTQVATTLPTSEGTALTWPSMESLDRAWPAVLEDYKFYTVVTNTNGDSVKDLLTYRIRQPFAGEVRVVNELWWQSTPYNIQPQNPMIASGIRVDGNLMSFSIPDCLHDTFVYKEQNIFVDAGVGVFLEMLAFTFGATGNKDWPETITKVKQTFKNGGYEVFRQVFYKPTEDGLEQALTVARTANTSSLPYYE